MRAIGEKPIVGRHIGENRIVGRYAGEEVVFLDYIAAGLLHRFDGINNEATGVHNPAATTWTDLVTGVQATMQNVAWQDFGVEFSQTTSKVFYSGQNVQEYTIFSTHKVASLTGSHPRFFAESPYPSLYLHSNNGYAYAFYGQGKDTFFSPRTTPPTGQLMQAAIRFGGTGVVELFLNGSYAGAITSVTAYPSPVSTMYIGSRAANDRALTGSIYEHLVYDRALSDAEIQHNFLVSKSRYQ